MPTSVELVETSVQPAPLVRHQPDYPPDALAERADGYVQLEFDVTAAGDVENVSVVRSTMRASSSPPSTRSRSGVTCRASRPANACATTDVRTIIRFVYWMTARTHRRRARRDRNRRGDPRVQLAYSAGLEVALDRLAADDLRGVELQLDEMQAVYGTERLDLWNFYGYLYTVGGNYSRAIDAYETAVAVAMRSRRPTSGPYVRLANLYFARHQYDIALKTLLRPQQVVAALHPAAPGSSARRRLR